MKQLQADIRSGIANAKQIFAEIKRSRKIRNFVAATLVTAAAIYSIGYISGFLAALKE